MRRNELDELRKGWDLILDIDCPYWILAKLITYVFIKALKDHNIGCVSVKFSGGKGFHIGVPFEAFPQSITKFDKEKQKATIIDIKDWFPEGPRKIAGYLLDYSDRNLINPDHEKRIIRFGKLSLTYDKFMQATGKTESEIMVKRCSKCNSVIEEKASDDYEYICPGCDTTIKAKSQDVMLCPKCKKMMVKKEISISLCKCGSNSYKDKLDIRKIVEIDTILISSRHLYRMPYSLHEKTGLVSVPFNINHILKFEKEEADIKNFKPYPYLNRLEAKDAEASDLFQKAFDQDPESVRDAKNKAEKDFEQYKKRTTSNSIMHTLEYDQIAVPEEFFPPCIKKISQGLEDGKKRALLVLINFLSACNWSYEKIEDYVLKWNEKNHPDRLRETYIRGQLRYFKSQKQKMSPPNCDNRGYMIDTQFCNPDNFCPKIKNPAQYASKKAWLTNNAKPKSRRKHEDDES
jgi:hypothetical protein